jgi:hypothetical protein
VSRRVLYLAHPLAGDITHNLASVRVWHRFLMERELDAAIIAPWIAAVEAGADDHDLAARERGLLDAEEIVQRCDGIVLCGERVSKGMQRELFAALMYERAAFSLVGKRISDWSMVSWPGIDQFRCSLTIQKHGG